MYCVFLTAQSHHFMQMCLYCSLHDSLVTKLLSFYYVLLHVGALLPNYNWLEHVHFCQIGTWSGTNHLACSLPSQWFF